MNQQNNLNNNLNFFPFIVQPNLQMNLSMNNMNAINQDQNNFIPIPKNHEIINVKFFPTFGKSSIIHISPDDKILELIKRYREKTKDFDDNWFLFDRKNLSDFYHLH